MDYPKSKKLEKMISHSFLLSLSVCLLWAGAEGQSSGDLRLVARDGRTSPSLTAGRLEVYYNGQWGTVCDDNFGQTEARIACSQLGFTAGYYEYQTIDSSLPLFSASRSTRTWLDKLSCSGSESRLIDCALPGTIGNEDCSHNDDIALYCLGNGALRLADRISVFSDYYGRLEVYYNGQWGTICNDLFGQTEANVACQQLGYSSASSYRTVGSSQFSTIWLDDVDCTSSELMLSSCSHNPFGVNDCLHSESVAVTCSSEVGSTLTDGAIIGITVAICVLLICIGICIITVILIIYRRSRAGAASSSYSHRSNASAAAITVPATSSTTATSDGYTPCPAELGKMAELQQYRDDPAYPPPQSTQPEPPPAYSNAAVDYIVHNTITNISEP